MIELSSLLSGDFGLDAGLLSLGIVFSIAALAFIPRPPLCVLGGLFFGLAAFPVALAGTTLGAVVAFLVSRYLFRARFSVIAGRRPRLKLVLDAIDAEGWRLVGLLRLASPVPGSASNYLFGLTNIGVRAYVAATFLGSAPQVLAFVYLGTAGRITLDAQSVSATKLAFLLAGCALSLCAIVLVSRRVKSLVTVRIASQAKQVRAPSPSTDCPP
ncbi:MAG: TVP38/TMEM64 family protein [Xanthobacteraceae bacterium]